MLRELGIGSRYLAKSSNMIVDKITGRLPEIEYFFWEVTEECNSRCKHCNIWARKPSADNLTLEEVERLFESGLFKKVSEVIISGGEPVLMPDLFEKLSVMHRHIKPDALISLSTNGLLPDKVLALAERCVSSGMNIIVGVSLDGVGVKHDAVRGIKGNFEKVDYLLNNLLAMGKRFCGKLHVTVGFTLGPWTVDSTVEVKEYAESLGMNFLPQMYEQFTYYSNEKRKTPVYADDAVKAIGSLRDCFQKELLMRCVTGDPLSYRCASMKKFFILHSNGDISPCLRFAHVRAGNVRKDFKDVWKGPGAEEARRLVDKCRGCSNTWATGWSMKYWVPPFIKILSKTVIKKHMARVRTHGGAV